MPRLTRTEAQARNILAQHALRCDVRIGQDWHARLALLPLGEQTAPVPSALVIGAEWAGARFCLSLPEGALGAWARANMTLGQSLARMPEALALAALELLFADLTAAADKLGRGRLQLTHLAAATPSLEHRLLLTLQQANGNEAIHGLLHADSLGLMVLSSLVASVPPAGNDLPLADLPLPLRFEIGEATLRAGDIKALSPHDVIWLSSGGIGGDGKTFVVIGGNAQQTRNQTARARLGFPARIEGHQLTVLEPLRQVMTDTKPMTAEANPLDLGQIPVHLTFELGGRAITLQELQNMQPGQVFDLGRSPERAVAIRANGALIGSGELVEIEKRIGVAVVSLSQAPAAEPVREEE